MLNFSFFSGVRSLARVGVLALGAALVAPVAAQPFPAKPIRLIVPLGVGGSTDILARLLAPAIQEETGQPLIVENRPGAEGVIGVKAVSTAPPDGYTVLMGTNGTHVTYAHSSRTKAYDPVKDFEPVTSLLTLPILLYTNAQSQVTELKDIVKRAKEQPNQVMFGSATNSQRLLIHMVSQAAGIQVVEVPFKATTAAMIELAAGRLDVVFTDATSSTMDRVRPLASMTNKRVQALPKLPTIAEAGVDVKALPVFFGIWAPSGTPRPVVDRLNAIFANAMKTPRVTEFLAKNSAELLLMSPDDFRRFQLAEIDRVGPIIKSSGLEIQ